MSELGDDEVREERACTVMLNQQYVVTVFEPSWDTSMPACFSVTHTEPDDE